jgi:pimeloyl-ACP methyl ester carboxylesterase
LWSGSFFIGDGADSTRHAAQRRERADLFFLFHAHLQQGHILWQEHDPIFPIAWADQLDHFFTNYKFERLSGVGHFTPLEATEKFAAAIIERLEK